MKLFGLLETKYSRLSTAFKTELNKVLTDYNTKYGDSSIFGQMINVLTASVQNIMLYLEDALTEQNKYTAQRKKSIYNLAALSGYNPSTGKASCAQLLITFTPNNYDKNNLNVIINNHEKLVCTQNGLLYNIVLPQESVVMSLDGISDHSRIVQAVQGRFEKQSFLSTGGKYYTINLQCNGNVDQDYITVKVNNHKWEKCDSLYDMEADGIQYFCKTSYSGGLDFVFGNDVHGRSLKNNDVIEIEYLVHDGVDGNLNSMEHTYFVFDNELKDTEGNEIDGNAVFNITFASNDSVTSGSDSESKEQVRQMIGLNSRSLVLAAPQHYKAFINKFSFCGYNRTWSDRGSMIINSMILKNFKNSMETGNDYFELKESDFLLSDNQKQSILNYIETSGNQLSGVVYNILNPTLRKYVAYIYVKMKNKRYDELSIKNHIKVLVGDFFANVQSDIYIPKSDLIHIIKENVSGIDSIDVYFVSEQNDKAIYDSKYIDKETGEVVYVFDDQNPNLGLDDHGNIYLKSNNEFPILRGWKCWYENGNYDRFKSVPSSGLSITIE